MNLIKSFLLTFFITVLISCGGAEERKAVYLEKAKISINAGNYDKARIELKNVLQIDPKDSNAYYQLGEVFFNLKDYKKSYANYLKAEELNPDLLVNKAKLGNIYLYLIKDTDKAQEIIDYILEKDPANLDAKLLQAGMLVKDKKVSEATSIVVELNSSEPAHIDVALFLASLYANDKNHTDAISVLDGALKSNKGSIRLTKSLALYLVRNKEYERAEALFLDNLEKNSNAKQSYVTLAVFYNQIGEKEKSEDILRDSIKNDPEDEDRYFDLIRFISTTSGNDAAILELREVIKNNQGIGKLRIVLAEYLLKNNKKDEAITIYKELVNDFSEEVSGVNARLALAIIYIRDNNVEEASRLLEEAIVISPNDPKVNLVRAKIALHNKDTEKAILSLRVVTKETPDNIEAFMLLVKAYRLEGNRNQVKSTLNSAYENNKLNPKGLLTLSQFYLKRDVTKAEKIIDRYNGIKENDYYGQTIKAVILNQNKNYTEAYEIANKLIDLFSDKPNGYLQSIPYLSSVKDKAATISNLEKGYLNAEDNRKILQLLTTLQVSEKQFDVVEKRLTAEIKSKPDDIELKILLSKVYVSQQKIDQAEKVLKQGIAVNSKNESLYLLLSRIYQSKNELNEVESILISGKENLPTSIKIPLRLASLYEAQKKYDQAIIVYRSMYNLHSENLLIVNNLASMLSDHGSMESDLKFAKSLAEKLETSGQAVFLDTVGWVHYKLGDYAKAIEYIHKVLETAPDVGVFNYHLGMAYKMSGNKEQAKIFLEKSINTDKPFKQKELAEAALEKL